MAIKHIARQYDYIGLSTDDKTSITTEGAVIYYVDTKKTQVYHNGNWHDKSNDSDIVDVIESTSDVLDLVFHDESTTSNAGLELEVGNYKNLRISISGTATAFQLNFRGQLGTVNNALLGIESTTLEIATETTTNNTTYVFGIEGYDKIWFGLSTVSGGNITVVGKVS